MDMTTIFFYAIGAIVVLFILRYILVAQGILGFMLKRPSFQLIDRGDCPQHIQEFYAIKEKELLDMGFHFYYCCTIEDMLVKKHSLRYHFIYYHPEKKTYAALSASPEADHYFPFRVGFDTYFKNGKKLTTVNGTKHLIMHTIPHTILQDEYVGSLEKQLAVHLEYLNKNNIEDRDIKIFAETKQGVEEMLAYENRVNHEYIDRLEKKGIIYKTGENQYLIKTLSSIAFAHRQLQGLGKINTMKRQIMQKEKPSPPDIPVRMEVENYENALGVLNQKTRNTSGKIAFLLFTVILFTLAFGFLFSFALAFLLVIVIFIHEGGHLLAMSLLGYKDLKMLFIPLFGAVALGTAKNVPPHKKVITYFAGPVPGILLAFLILAIFRYTGISILSSPTLLTALVVLLVINYFNLVPVMPLDGGQILNTIFFSRFPIVQFIFLIISFLSLAAIALYLQEPILLIAVLIIPFAFRNHFIQRKLIIQLQQRLKNRETPPETSLIEETFSLLKQPPYNRLPFQRKIQVAKYVEENVNASKASGKTIILTLLFYAIIFILPVGYFLVHGWSGMAHFLPKSSDPCLMVQEMKLPQNTRVEASRFQRISPTPEKNPEMVCYRYCFLSIDAAEFDSQHAPAGNFLSRLWALYGKPDMMENSFLYTLKDKKTNLIFTAYCHYFVPAFGAYKKYKSEKEMKKVLSSLVLFDQLLQQTDPVDCQIEIDIDFSKFNDNVIDEEEYRQYPEQYKATYKIGSQKGVPYIEIKQWDEMKVEHQMGSEEDK
jgi:Zn-dependent protease